MGRRGPVPMSSSLRMLKGNPGRRPMATREPVVPLGIPPPPEVLTGVALEEWRRLTPLLFDAGLLTHLDRTAVALYCVAWGDWLDAEAHLRQFGTVVRKVRGGQGPSPWLRVANTAYAQMRALANELGLSPASRSRIHVDPPKPESALDVFTRRHDHTRVAAKRRPQKLQSSPPGEDT
jgi:P27 family predicted phage terminase small subunit